MITCRMGYVGTPQCITNAQKHPLHHVGGEMFYWLTFNFGRSHSYQRKKVFQNESLRPERRRMPDCLAQVGLYL